MPDAGDPAMNMSRLLGGFRVTQMLFAAAELKVAEALAEGALSVAELAGRVGAHPGSLRRLLRALAAHGVFTELEDGRFSTTPMAATLHAAAPGSLRAAALSYGQPWWWGAFGGLAHSVRTGEPAFERVNGEPLFAYLDHHPAAAGLFHGNMSAMTEPEAAAVAEAYDFGSVGQFLDVGGGQGTLTSALLSRWPNLRGTVFDQPSTLAGIRLPENLRARCELVGGDFFEGIPPGADLYLLKDILHDWEDPQALAILQGCRRAMGSGSRLLVIERLMPPGNEPASVKEIDITMLVMTGGLERTFVEYEKLLTASGFTSPKAIPLPTGASLLEALPQGA
jgi:hypothetical protein